jgi:hypothetical protein
MEYELYAPRPGQLAGLGQHALSGRTREGNVIEEEMDLSGAPAHDLLDCLQELRCRHQIDLTCRFDPGACPVRLHHYLEIGTP